MIRRTSIRDVLAILLLIIPSTTACKKEDSSPTLSPAALAEAVRSLRPCLRIEGHEGDIVSDFGVPMDGLAVSAVGYRAGTEFPPHEFLDDIRKHLRRLGWRPLEYSLEDPPRLVGDGSIWEKVTTDQGVLHIWNQPRTKEDELLDVLGQYYPTVPQGSEISVGVYLTVSLYKPDHAKVFLANYASAQKRLSGEAEKASTPNDHSP